MRPNLRAIRKDPATRAIARAWQYLRANERRAILAVSGGADSGALALALAASGLADGCTIAHVRHTMRAEPETKQDSAHVRELAAAIGLAFEARAIDPATQASEGAQRVERYELLARVASERGASAVATGHHADDQLETMLMAMLRGAGARGLGGMRRRRELTPGCALIRPMLDVTHADACRLCELAEWPWIEDPTNRETDRTRSALRERVLPALRALQSDASQRASRSATIVQLASDTLDQRVRELLDAASDGSDEFQWERASLAAMPDLMVSAVIRAAAIHIARDSLGDRFSFEESAKAARCVIEGPDRPAVFEWAFGVRVEIDHHRVRVRRTKTNEAPDGAGASGGACFADDGVS
ncbi:MAG: tRNA lysidine(34) synthetase TilS [Planctomycetota bacterium]